MGMYFRWGKKTNAPLGVRAVTRFNEVMVIQRFFLLLTRFFYGLILASALAFSACSSSGTGEDSKDGALDAGDRDDDGTPEGEPCLTQEECVEGTVCAIPLGCEGEGVCSAPPGSCSLHIDPVCGCDGITYTNECAARSKGVNIAHRGECPMPKPCTDSGECGASEYCASASCSDVGVCLALPATCEGETDRPGAEVCGCDEVRYADLCALAEAGAATAEDAVCEGSDPKACATDSDCAASEFCAKERCADEAGACSKRPEICIELPTDGVCGCDGKDYPSVCAAHSAGVNVRHEGACKTIRRCTPDNDGPPQCEPDEYCAIAPDSTDFNACAGEGICEQKPWAESCISRPQSVCGCDGKNYRSECLAHAAGVRVSNLPVTCPEDPIPLPPEPPIHLE